MATINDVNPDLRLNTKLENLNVDLYDVAHVTVRHEYRPSDNVCKFELKIPALERSMTSYDFTKLKEMCLWDTYHEIVYNKVLNKEFYSYVKKEKIHKLRVVEDDRVITYYLSLDRTTGFMDYDYFTALLIYPLYPIRGYIRRAPCTKLDPECKACPDTLAKPIASYMDVHPSVDATYDKYCFSLPGELHHIVIGYTIDYPMTISECKEVKHPEYYVIEQDNIYFKKAFHDYDEWKEDVIKRRRDFDGIMYRMYDGAEYQNEENLEEMKSLRGKHVGNTGAYKRITISEYNMFKRENIPEDMKIAVDELNFDLFWHFDFYNANARNSMSKWQFNEWIEQLNAVSDGFYCAWNMTETMTDATESIPGDTSAMSAQVLQAAGSVGWGMEEDSDVEGRVATFELAYPRFAGVEYEVYEEKIPDRKN